MPEDLSSETSTVLERRTRRVAPWRGRPGHSIFVPLQPARVGRIPAVSLFPGDSWGGDGSIGYSSKAARSRASLKLRCQGSTMLERGSM